MRCAAALRASSYCTAGGATTATSAPARSAADTAEAEAEAGHSDQLESLLRVLVKQINDTNWVASQPKDGPNLFDVAAAAHGEGAGSSAGATGAGGASSSTGASTAERS